MSSKRGCSNTPTDAPPSFVWATVGKTQHAALLLATHTNEQECLLQWTTTKVKEWVPLKALTPLSKRKRVAYDYASDKSDEEEEASPRRSRLKPKKHALSSAEKQSPLMDAMESTNNHLDDLPLTQFVAQKSASSKSFCGERTTESRTDPVDPGALQSFCANDAFDQQSGNAQDPICIDDTETNLFIKPAASLSTTVLVASRAVLSEQQSNGSCNGTTTTTTTTIQKFSYASSAYVQNLAEIAYTIMNDRRWRTSLQGHQQLVQWEYGDDVTAVALLSRCFVPRPQASPSIHTCTCILCGTTADTNSHDVVENPQPTVEVEGHNSSSSNNNQIKDSDDDVDRSLYLYCRLYYRKGPWFRLDDVLTKYYAFNVVQVKDAPNDVNTGVAINNCLKSSRDECFQTKSVVSAEPVAEAVVDPTLLACYSTCLDKLVADLEVLHGRGLLRSFHNERECGTVVGVSLLRADERALVLSKLGVSGKKKTTKNTTDDRENQVLKQMMSQRTIFAKSHGSILAVRKHVDEVLLQKLARTIIQVCTRVDSVGAKLMRAHSPAVVNMIRTKFKSLSHQSTTALLCFRLREAPLMTLYRCARLYLCATSGPGSMRGDGTNGWRSLRSVAQPTPLINVVPPPGLEIFHQVVYPGLSHTFGLSSSCFIDAYKHLPFAEESKNGAARHDDVHIFSNKHAFESWEICVELRAHADYLIELNSMLKYLARRKLRGAQPLGGASIAVFDSSTSVDFLSLSSATEREKVVVQLLPTCSDPDLRLILAEVESHVRLIKSKIVDDQCDLLLCIIAVVSMHILCFHNQSISEVAYCRIKTRPWLRHLHWEGCLAYILFDTIPFLERYSLYKLSIKAIQVLLFGRLPRMEGLGDTASMRATRLAPLLLSRRARGKAIDRLIIDYNHLQRLERKEENKASKTHECEVADLCVRTINAAAGSGFISFSAIRGLARRLKQPLSSSLKDIFCLEAVELGLRYENTPTQQPHEQKINKYSDWTAITDRAVANALQTNDENGAGSRCAFVGFEDGGIPSSSLNVEELAMEFYSSGRLPAMEHPGLKGGWKGWHDEGNRVRSLFRIICSAPLLGMDWGCKRYLNGFVEPADLTVHLSPYQTAPFDLHVGFETVKSEFVVGSERPTAGFYYRHRSRIESVLDKLTGLSSQEISDLVYDSIVARVRFMSLTKRKDPFAEKDLLQLRTLSALAASLGGRQLSSIFRCLCFDYRYFSGGLPDLTLIRAQVDLADGSTSRELLDLGDWVGEAFSKEVKDANDEQRFAALLADADGEFLGCTKVGDSGASSRSRRRATPFASMERSSLQPKIDAPLPERLSFLYNNRQVHVECMLVEVKSSNDRLDPRQEDWLNVLDRNGHARVCKFEDTRGGKKIKKDDKVDMQKVAALLDALDV
jgi:hypothetical protein